MADAQTYHLRKNRYLVISIATQLLFFSTFILFNAATPILEALQKTGLRKWALMVGFATVFFAIWQTVNWPVRYLSGWRLEKAFKMTRQTFGGWLIDALKSSALSLIFFLLSTLVFYAVIFACPADWWWILTMLTFIFSAFFATLFPVFILPMFYKYSPLKDPDLAARLQKSLGRCGFPKLPLFEIKLGEKTVRANAMLAGFGKTRRAMISDTLLKDYSEDEIVMVLAHEAGHHARGHLWRTLAIDAALSMGGFFLLFCLTDPALAGMEFFPVLVLLSYASGLALMPLHNGISRMHEREADRFALSCFPDMNIFRSLMEKLAKQNLSNPEPGHWEEFFLYTHPSKKNRIASAEKFLGMRLANKGRAD